MNLDDYFKAIYEGDVARVKYWFKERAYHFQAIDEAALDLAMRLNYPEVVQAISVQLEKEAAAQLQHRVESQQKPNDLYKRSWLTFDRDHYFSGLLFESSTKGAISLCVIYKTALQAPWIHQPLLGLGGIHNRNHVMFQLSLAVYSEDQIRNLMQTIVQRLYALKKKDGSDISPGALQPLLDAVETFFVDAHNDFPQPDPIPLSPWIAEKNSYEAFKLYRAINILDHKEILRLLRSGVNPNSSFAEEQPLRTAIYLGMSYVFNQKAPFTEAERRQSFLKIIQLLIEYGAQDNLDDEEQTLMEYLVGHEAFVKSAEAKLLCAEVIALLSAVQTARPHIDVHPSLSHVPLARTIQQANQEMVKKLQRKACVIGVESKGATLVFAMMDGARVELQSNTLDELDHNELDLLFQFFDSQQEISRSPFEEGSSSIVDKESKRAYFTEMLQAHAGGKAYVDRLWHNGQFCGFILSDLLCTSVDNEPTLIYYGKLALASLPAEYAGLLKSMIVLRWFAGSQSKDDIQRLAYYEAGSVQGYGVTDILKRYPAFLILSDRLPEVMDIIYRDSDLPRRQINELWYVKDPYPFDVRNKAFAQRWPTFTSIVRDNYRSEYYQPGWMIPVLVPASLENYRLFERAIMPMVGEEAFKSLIHFFQTDMKNEFARPAFLRAKL